MKTVFLGLFAAAVLSAGLVADGAPATAADLSLTPSRVAARHYRHVTVVRPRCPGSVAEYAESGWSDRCFWWAYHWQDYRGYRSYARAVRYSDVVSYRN